MRLIARTLLAVTLAMLIRPAYSGENGRTPKVEMAIPVDAATDAPFQRGFRDGLRESGYVDGRNVTLVVRYANGDAARLREQIKDLISLPVDVLVGDAPPLKEATSTIPIVSPSMGDPVRTGLVASLHRPGGNLTGVSWQLYDILEKQLELARELLPSLRNLALLFDETDEPNVVRYAQKVFSARARSLGIGVRMIPIANLDGIRAALKTLTAERPQVLVILDSPLITQHHRMIVGAVANRIPVLGQQRHFADAGALLTYSPDGVEMFRRSASYVAKILDAPNSVAALAVGYPRRFAPRRPVNRGVMRPGSVAR